ncbi:MAG: RDD family protein [Sedimentisphaerales bacterium]|nr:RDD family protein [Sedimentisphaerales bacterium]
MNQAIWYYLVGEQQVGPVSFEDIKTKVTEGVVAPESYVWREGYSDWVKAWQVQALFADGANPSGVNPPSMPGVPVGAYYYPVSTPVVTYAGFWKRFAAILLDGLILLIPKFAMVGIINTIAISQDISEEKIAPLANLPSIILEWLYFALMTSSSCQATLGKLALGIKVTDLNDRRISFGRATGRYFASILSALTLLIGFLMAGFTAKKQALHDMIAGTLVVNRES